MKASSSLNTALSQQVDTKLAPVLAQAQTTAASIHDAVLKVNGALEVLDRFPGGSVPTLSPQLGSMSDRVQEATAAVQDLRDLIAGDRDRFDASLPHHGSGTGAPHLCLLAVYSPWMVPIPALDSCLASPMLF